MSENEQVTLIATDVSGERWISKPLSAAEASEIVKTVKLVFQENAAGYMKFNTDTGGTIIINIAHIVTVQIRKENRNEVTWDNPQEEVLAAQNLRDTLAKKRSDRFIPQPAED